MKGKSLVAKLEEKAKTAGEIETEMLATWKEDRCVKKKAEKWVKLSDVLDLLEKQGWIE